jgi:hypothetical protein
MANLSNIITPSNVLTATNTQTIANKTISFSSNTLTGVAPLVSPTFTGTVALPSGTSLTAPVLDGAVSTTGSVRQTATAVAALDVDCSASNYFTKTIAATSTFTFSNPPTSGTAYAFTLEVVHTSGTITWPAAVKWPGNTAPTLTTSRTHLITFVTDNAGTTWYGVPQTNYLV